MNPASHLLIAAPCYFTFLLSFSFSLQRKRRKFPVSVPFYLSRYTPSRSRDRSISYFSPPFLDPSPKNVGAFNGNSKTLCFLVPYPSSVGSRTRHLFRTVVSIYPKVFAPGVGSQENVFKSRRGIKSRSKGVPRCSSRLR